MVMHLREMPQKPSIELIQNPEYADKGEMCDFCTTTIPTELQE